MDRVYDHIRSLGLYPVVEVSFMPHDLASDPTKTVFDYDAIVSPPRDWQRWCDLVRDLTGHLLERYGQEVVDHWSFEVWNEANLEVFWSGTPEEYLRLYDVTVAAVRSVDDRLVVGGPSSAAAGWVEELLAHAEETGVPVGFVSTHTYGSPPLDFRPTLERYGRAGTPIWWTEWGVTPTHFNEVSDAVFAGTFLLRGMVSAMGRIEALSYWVVSDHFEELGRPPALLHGGFGLRTVGELRKPRWWALAKPAASMQAYSADRVTGVPAASAFSTTCRPRFRAAASSPRSRAMRAEFAACTRGASSATIHRTSSRASRCRVPRIGQVRTISPRSIASSTCARVAPWVRRPTAHSAAW